jgi:hypothetical protein
VRKALNSGVLVTWLVLGTACSRVGDPPPWWPAADPIHDSMFCKDLSSTAAREPAHVAEALKEHSVALQACYAELAQRNPDAAGVMQAELSVRRDGTVSDACVALNTTLNDNAAATCMLVELRTIKFNPPGEDTRVTVPLAFKGEPATVPYQPTPPSTRDLHCDPNPEFGTPCTGAR